jgi:hypothetical protein
MGQADLDAVSSSTSDALGLGPRSSSEGSKQSDIILSESKYRPLASHGESAGGAIESLLLVSSSMILGPTVGIRDWMTAATAPQGSICSTIDATILI